MMVFIPHLQKNGTLVFLFYGNLNTVYLNGDGRRPYNPDRQIAVMNPIGLPFVSDYSSRSKPSENSHGSAGTGSGVQPMYGVPYGVEMQCVLFPFGLPICKQPVWGFVAGVDLNTHEVAWKRRIGTIRDSHWNSITTI